MLENKWKLFEIFFGWVAIAVSRFADLRRWATNRLIHVLFFLRGYTQISFEEIKLRQYSTEDGITPFDLGNCSTIDDVLEQTEKMVEREEGRLEHIWEKFKVMLTICGLLLAAIGALFSKYQKSPDFAAWMAVPMVLLALAGFVLFVFHEAGTVYSVALDQNEVTLDRDNFVKSLINSNMIVMKSMGGKIDFFVDLYQVCRSILVVAWVMFMFSWLVLVFSPNQPVSAEKLQLIEGPAGPPGPRGPCGEAPRPLAPIPPISSDGEETWTPPFRERSDLNQRKYQSWH